MGPIWRRISRLEFDLESRGAEPQSAAPIRFWDVDRFQEVRWGDGPCVFDNRKGLLP